MNLGISQLAFNNNQELSDIAPILKENKIKNIEIIPNKMNEIGEETNFIAKKNDLTFRTSQSILFGSDIQDFMDSEFSQYIINLFERLSRYGTKLLVLGSPGQRKIFNEEKLVEQFRLIDQSIPSGCVLCIEPNCKEYGGSYFFTIEEIAEFIKKNKFRNIKTMIDTHNIINEGGSPSKVFEEYVDLINHVHVSEVGLTEFEESIEHIKLANSLKEFNYKGIITYEVKPHDGLEKSLQKFNLTYK
jgi:sugar phosphate isomerase/epimerase